MAPLFCLLLGFDGIFGLFYVYWFHQHERGEVYDEKRKEDADDDSADCHSGASGSSAGVGAVYADDMKYKNKKQRTPLLPGFAFRIRMEILQIVQRVANKV